MTEDAISRKAVIDTLDNMDKALDTERTVEEYKALLIECYKVLPPVTPKQRTGHWEENVDNSRRWDRRRFYCSECGSWQTYGKTGFCPNCGARMEGEDEDE